MCHDSFHATLIWDMTHSYVTCGIAGRTYSTNTAVRGFPLQHHLNEPCHTWMSHVMCECVISHMKEWVMSRVNASCHIWKNESCHVWMRHVTYERMSHVTCECVISHMKEWVMSCVNASCHIWKNESCHVWMRHVTYERMSHVMCECVISHMKVWVMSRVNASCHIWKNESHRNEASHVTLTVRIQLCADSHCNTCLTLALHVSTRAPAQGVWRHDSFTYADSCRFVRTLSDVPCITFALHRAPAQSA